VLTGIFVFAFGAPLIKGWYPDREAQILAELKEISQAESGELSVAAHTRTQLTLLQKVHDVWTLPVGLKRDAKAFQDKPEAATKASLQESIKSVRLVFEGIKAGKSDQKFDSDGSLETSFNPSVWMEAKSLCEKGGLSPDAALTNLSKLDAWQGTSMPTAAMKEPPPEVNDFLAKLGSIASEINLRLRNAKQAQDRIDLESGTRLAQAEVRKAREDKLTREMTELSSQKNNVMLMTWLPDFSLRVGTVILLLFLTGVCVNTYRYSMSMAAFYDARGDTLDLVAAPDLSTKEALARVAALAKDLSPPHTLDGLKLPYEVLGEPAKDALQALAGVKA
jgi:hypothetical protein